MQGGVRGLRYSGATVFQGSLINNTRCRLSCNAEKAVTGTSISTSPLVSTPVTKVDNTRRSLVTVGAVRCASGDVSRRSTSEVQLRRMQAPMFASAFGTPSSIIRGLRPAAVGATSGLPTWSSFSSSTDVASKKAQGLTLEKGVDGVSVAAADVAQVAEPRKEEPRHAHIEMPSITDVGGIVCFFV